MGNVERLLVVVLIMFSCQSGCLPKSTKTAKGDKGKGAETCIAARSVAICNTTTTQISINREYRTFDGTCNNLQNPLWGSSETPLKRLLPPVYEDGINAPIGWNINPPLKQHGYAKPSVRKVSQDLLTSRKNRFNEKFSNFVMLWGQFLTHDIDGTSGDALCKTCKRSEGPSCFPVMEKHGEIHGCVPFTRSYRQCGTGDTTPRQQMNDLTSYIDASMIYGNTEAISEQLRDFSDDTGFLKVGSPVVSEGIITNKYLLPEVAESQKADCHRLWYDNTDVDCFFSGDRRSNENLGLMALQTIWMREHNRIAAELRKLNPLWSGNTTYQETRKIIGALIQDITYEHWLPIVLGDKGMQWLGEYKGYDPTVDVSATNVFATVAFRYGHNQVGPDVYRLYNHSDIESFRSADGKLALAAAAMCPYRLKYEGGVDPVLRGIFGTPLKDVNPDNILSDQITNHLFDQAIDADVIAHDLASLDIQRGRDHGLPGYNDWRAYVNNFLTDGLIEDIYPTPVANSFDDIEHEISDGATRDALKKLYGHPGNIDLVVAGWLEDPLDGGLLGPTNTALVVEQMRRLRAGDRLWCMNPGVFTDNQAKTIMEHHSLARVLCDGSDNLEKIQDNVFLGASYPDGYKLCSQISSMNLTYWKTDILGNWMY